MVDLKAKPFYLNDEQIKWVNDTISKMTLDEKIGQLFVHFTAAVEEEDVKSEIRECRNMGGIRFNPLEKEAIWEMNYNYQKHSKIPVLSAVNTESGGIGATKSGTYIGNEMKIAATRDKKLAYQLGLISGIEAKAVGCNWAFAPITDLVLDWHNPGISTRGWGSDPELVLEFSKEYFRGMTDAGMVCAMKHFPGDGADERDPHVSSSTNPLSVEEWDRTYGYVYRGMIEAGIHSVMPGHIMLPAYQKYFNPEIEDRDLLPATLCKEILTDLLRGKLGFNGLIVSDASHMVGVAGRMKRSELVPRAIQAGCDMFLFYNDPDEDFEFMKNGYLNGIITEERLHEALQRILGLKAAAGLANFSIDKFPPFSGLAVVGKPEYKKITQEVSDKAITLVKSIEEEVFPVTPERYKRILLVPVGPEPDSMLSLAGMGVDGSQYVKQLKEKLEARGLTVNVYVDPIKKNLERMKKAPKWLMKLILRRIAKKSRKSKGAYGMKQPIRALTENFDLVLSVANVTSTMKTVQRLEWAISKGGWDNPWYVNDIPTIFVSFACPFHLADVPQVKNYINCYDADETTIDALIDKLAGKSEFKGTSPVDAFCGFIDTRI